MLILFRAAACLVTNRMSQPSLQLGGGWLKLCAPLLFILSPLWKVDGVLERKSHLGTLTWTCGTRIIPKTLEQKPWKNQSLAAPSNRWEGSLDFLFCERNKLLVSLKRCLGGFCNLQLYRILSGANRMSHKPRPVGGQRADNQKATRQTVPSAGQRRNIPGSPGVCIKDNPQELGGQKGFPRRCNPWDKSWKVSGDLGSEREGESVNEWFWAEAV